MFSVYIFIDNFSNWANLLLVQWSLVFIWLYIHQKGKIHFNIGIFSLFNVFNVFNVLNHDFTYSFKNNYYYWQLSSLSKPRIRSSITVIIVNDL